MLNDPIMSIIHCLFSLGFCLINLWFSVFLKTQTEDAGVSLVKQADFYRLSLNLHQIFDFTDTILFMQYTLTVANTFLFCPVETGWWVTHWQCLFQGIFYNFVWNRSNKSVSSLLLFPHLQNKDHKVGKLCRIYELKKKKKEFIAPLP